MEEKKGSIASRNLKTKTVERYTGEDKGTMREKKENQSTGVGKKIKKQQTKVRRRGRNNGIMEEKQGKKKERKKWSKKFSGKREGGKKGESYRLEKTQIEGSEKKEKQYRTEKNETPE